MVLRLNRIEPDGGKCPEGYEYVHGHREHTGKYVRNFCRKIPEKRIKLTVDARYPGDTRVKASIRQGFHGEKMEANIPTETLISNNPDLKKIMNSDWRKTGEFNRIEDKKRRNHE